MVIKCKHDWRLLQKWLMKFGEEVIIWDSNREIHKFYCTKCLKLKIKEYK